MSKSYIFHRRLDYSYPIITHGKGIYLYDESGKKYIDACGGSFVVNIGHGIKEIADEMQKLAGKYSFLHGAQFTTKNMEKYAEELSKVVPKGMKVFFVSGGSEAIESAVKLAKQYHYDSGNKGKYKVIRRKPAYHGSTILSLSLGSKESMCNPQSQYLLKFPSIPAPFCYRCPFNKSYPKCNLKCAWELERVIKKEGSETVSAFIAEPVIGISAPVVVPPPEYFFIIRKICDKYNVLLILDEILTGFGRTGKWFACQHWNLKPDIIVAGKGISGGFIPLAAVFSDNKIMRTIKKGKGNFLHGFTYENHPLTTGTGRAVLKYIKKHNLVRQSAEKGKYLLSKLRAFTKFDIVGDVRGIGLMVAVEFVEDKKTKKPFSRDKHLAEKIVQTATKKGLNLYFSIGFVDGKRGDAVLVGPPLIVTKKEIDKIVNIFKKVILEVQRSL